jgi:MerR family transcriptional regulator, light-induced transcriptional regulator
VQEVIVFDFRGAVPDTGASTVLRLGDTPIAARDRLLARLDDRRAAPPVTRPVRLAASAATH